MKNREKFRDEIIKSAKSSSECDACTFKIRHVLPRFGGDGKNCSGYSCKWCYILCDLWLDEEYEEPSKPEVDWSKVPVDTLVMVKDFEGEEWVLRYFKEIDENCEESKYVTWIAGSTSKTAYGFTEYWNHCELVEEEEAKTDSEGVNV